MSAADPNPHDPQDDGTAQLSPQETGADAAPAWELIENGRYRPRRIRGSCRGRELG